MADLNKFNQQPEKNNHNIESKPVQTQGGLIGGVSDMVADTSGIDFEAFKDQHFTDFTAPVMGMNDFNPGANVAKASTVLGNIDMSFHPGIDMEFVPTGYSEEDRDKNERIKLSRRGVGVLDALSDVKPKTVGANPDPIFFGNKAVNFDRFYTHPDYQENGFHPYVDNEELYTKTASFVDDFSRMRSQYEKLYFPALTSSWRAAGDLFSADESYLGGDLDGAASFQDAMRVGNSNRGGVGGFANNFALNSAFTVGILSSIAIEEVVLALAAGAQAGLNPIADAALISRTGYNITRGANALRAFSKSLKGTKAASSSRSLLTHLRKADNARDYFNAGARFAGNLIAPQTFSAVKNFRTVRNTLGATKGIASTSRTFGAFYRDMRAINLAIAESKLEGGMVYSDRFNEQYMHDRDAAGGQSLDNKTLDAIHENASKAEFATVMFNAPFIFLTNKLVLGTALKGFRGIGKMTRAAKNKISERVLVNRSASRTGKDVKKFFKGSDSRLKRIQERGFKGNLSEIGGGILSYTSANFGEGAQELYQEGVSFGVKDYYANQYDDPSITAHDLRKTALKRGLESQWSHQGLEVFMSGFLMGGTMQLPQHIVFEYAPQKYEQWFKNGDYEAAKAKREKYIDDAIVELNEMYENPEEFFDINKESFYKTKTLMEQFDRMDYAGDMLGLMNKKDAAIYNALNTMMTTNTSVEFESMLSDYLGLSDTELTEAFAKEVEDYGVVKTRSRIQKMKDRVKEVEKQYKKYNEEFVNPYDSSQFKKGTKDWEYEVIREMAFEKTKQMIIFNKQMMTRAIERYNSVYGMLSEDPVFKDIAANDIAVLANMKDLVAEMTMLESEISTVLVKPESQVDDVDIEENDLQVKERNGKRSYIKQVVTDHGLSEEESDKVNTTTHTTKFTMRRRGKDGKMKSSNSGALALSYDELVEMYEIDEESLELLEGSTQIKLVEERLNKKTGKAGITLTVNNDNGSVNFEFAVNKKADYTSNIKDFSSIKTKEMSIDEDTALDELSEGERDLYFKKKRKIELLQEIKDVLTNEKHIIKSKFKTDEQKQIAKMFGSIHAKYGTFDRRHWKKLEQPVMNYLKFLAETQDQLVLEDNFKEFITKLLDYKALKGRAREFNIAINMLVDPEEAVRVADRMSVHMLKLFRDNRTKVEARVRKHVQVLDGNLFLNELADEGIYPEDAEVRAFMKDVTVVPKNYRVEAGPLTENSDKSKYDKLVKIIDDHLTRINPDIKVSEELNTEEASPSQSSEEKFEDIIDNINTDKLNEAVENSDRPRISKEDMINITKGGSVKVLPAPVKEILDLRYVEYLNRTKLGKGVILSKNQWKKTPESLKLLSASVELYNSYVESESDVKFEDWLFDNRTDEAFRTILNNHDLKYSDVAIKVIPNKFRSTSISSYDEILEDKSGSGVHINKKVISDGSSDTHIYTLVDSNNKRYTTTIHDTLESVQEEQSGLTNITKEGGAMRLEDVELNTNDVLVDKEGNMYVVISKPSTWNGSQIRVVPAEQAHMNKPKVKTISAHTFKSQGWKKAVDEDISISEIKEERITRVSILNPLMIESTIEMKSNVSEYYEGDKALQDSETKEEADKRQQKMIAKLTQKEKENLTLKISNNAETKTFLNAESTDIKDKQSFKIGDYPVNDRIKKHAQEYSVEIMNGDVSLGYLSGPTLRLFLDIEGNMIEPAIITEAQAKQVFMIPTSLGSYEATKQIKNNYLKSYHIYSEIARLLKSTSIGESRVVKITDLSNVIITSTPGEYAWASAKKGEQASKFDELDHKTINGKHYYILHKTRTSEGGLVFSHITNASGKVMIDLKKDVNQLIKSNRGSLASYGAYTAIIKTPDTDTYSFVELSAPVMSEEKVDQLLDEVRAEQSRILDLIEKGKLTEDDTDAAHAFNDSLKERLFIANSYHGTRVDIEVTHKGAVNVKLYNKEAFIKKDGKIQAFNESIVFGSKAFETIRSGKDFINAINDITQEASVLEDVESAKFESEVSKLDKALANKGIKNKRFKFKLKLDAFRESIPLDISGSVMYNSFLKDLQTKLKPEIRKNKRLVMNVTSTSAINQMRDALKIREDINNDIQNQENIKEEIEKEEVNIDDEVITKEIENAYEGRMISEEVKHHISVKIAGEESLSKGESHIYDEFATKDVDKIVDDIKGEGSNNRSDKKKLLTKMQSKRQTVMVEVAKEFEAVEVEKAGGRSNIDDATYAGIRMMAFTAANEDPRVTNIDRKISELTAALKVVKGVFDGNHVEDINTFISWVKENLPEQFHIESMDALGEKLKNNNIKVGEFLTVLKNASKGVDGIKGVIRVGELTPFKYHEAFHGVFRLLLTDSERAYYIKLGKQSLTKELKSSNKTLEQAITELKSTHSIYAAMSNKELEEAIIEEHLADEFDKFKHNPNSSAPQYKSLFTRLVEFIKSILGLSGSRQKTLHELYNDINSGGFKMSKNQVNEHTKAALDGIVNPAFAILNIPMGVETRESTNVVTGESRDLVVTTYIPAKKTQEIIGTIALRFLEEKESNAQADGSALDDIIDAYIDMLDVSKRPEFYAINDNFYEFAGKLKNYHDALSSHKEELKLAVLSNIHGFTVDKSDDIEDLESSQSEGLKSTLDYDLDPSMIGGKSSLSKTAKGYIGLTSLEITDEFGNEYMNPEAPEHLRFRLVVPVDSKSVYDGIIKNVKGSHDDTELMIKLALFSKSSKHTGAFVNRFFTDMGFTVKDVLSEGWSMPLTVANPLLFQSIMNSFRTYREDAVHITRDGDTYHMYAANHKDDANTQLEKWANSYVTKTSIRRDGGVSEQKENALDALDLLKGLLDTTVITDESLHTLSEEYSNKLFEATGIDISVGYIKYSVSKNINEADRTNDQSMLVTYNINIDHMTIEDVNQINKSVQNDDNLFKDFQDSKIDTEDKVEGGVKGRLRKIAKNNAQFDESVGASTYIDSEGNRRWAHRLASLHLELIEDMKRAGYLKEASKDEFLVDNALITDPRFAAILKSKSLNHISLLGHRDGKVGMSDEGDMSSSGGSNGTSYGKASTRDFMLNLLALYTLHYNKTSPDNTTVHEAEDGTKFVLAPAPLKVLSDSNTFGLVDLPVYHMVKKDNEGAIVLTDYATDRIIKEIEREYNRIQRENNPDNESKSIEGYNTGKAQTEGHNKGRLRALSFFRTLPLMSVRLSKLNSTVRVNENSVNKYISKAAKSDIINGDQKATLVKRGLINKFKLTTGSSDVVNLKVDGDINADVLMSNKGLISIRDIKDKKGLIDKLEGLVKKSKSDTHSRTIKVDGVTYYTSSWNIVNFFNPKSGTSMYLVEFDTNVEGSTQEDAYVITHLSDLELESLLEESVEDDDSVLYRDVNAEIERRLNLEMINPSKGVLSELTTKVLTSAKNGSKTAQRAVVAHAIDTMYNIAKEGTYSQVQEATLDVLIKANTYKESKAVIKLLQKHNDNISKVFASVKQFKSKFYELQVEGSDTSSSDILTFTNSIDNFNMIAEDVDITKGSNYKVDRSTPDSLLDSALKGDTWAEALETLVGKGIDIKGVVEEKQLQEVEDAKDFIMEVNAGDRISSDITKGLKKHTSTSKGKTKAVTDSRAKAISRLFNLTDDADYNLAQVIINMSLNSRSGNELIYGDESLSFKDMVVDMIKRAKAGLAAGTNFASEIIAPELGIHHKNKDINIITIDDPEFLHKYNNLFEGDSNRSIGEQSDGQMFYTAKGFRYTAFGDGRLTALQSAVLDKIEAGEEVTTADIYGARTLKAGLVLTVGISGSGKSRWINNLKKLGHNIVVVSPDVIRKELTLKPEYIEQKIKEYTNEMMSKGAPVETSVINRINNGNISDQSMNMEVFKIAEERAAAAVSKGNLVVFDATNLTHDGEFTNKNGVKIKTGRLALINKIKSKSTVKDFQSYYQVFDVDPTVAKSRVKSDIDNNVDRSNVPENVIDRQYDAYIKDRKNFKGMKKFHMKHVESKGLSSIQGMMNSKKLVYSDGTTFLKMSVSMLSKALTSVKVIEEGKEVWIARTGREQLHHLREKLEAYENETTTDENGVTSLVRETLAMAVFASGSKMQKLNVMSSTKAFSDHNEHKLVDDETTLLDARWLRRQMINPSNKPEILDPRQMKNLNTSGNTAEMLKIEVKLPGQHGSDVTTIGEIMDKYHKTTSSRVSNKYFRTRNLIFDLPTALNEIAKSKVLKEATLNLKVFMDYAISGLESAQSGAQMLDFFEVRNGEPVFNLNNTITEKKLESLFLSFFTKSVFSERNPGMSVALVSDVGVKVVKRAIQLDENNQPVQWEVIRSDKWEELKRKGAELDHEDYSEDNERKEKQLFDGMKEKHYYLDHLRHDVMTYNSKNEPTGIRGTEFMMPSHNKEEMEHLELDYNAVIPEEVARRFGIRIPSQDDHSSVNLILVDYIPSFYGSSAIFAKELIEISGADFDIDKLYIHKKEYYYNNGRFHEYGTWRNSSRGNYRDYIRYMIKEAGNRKSDMYRSIQLWSEVGDTTSAISNRTVDNFKKKFKEGPTRTNVILPKPQGLSSVEQSEYNKLENTIKSLQKTNPELIHFLKDRSNGESAKEAMTVYLTDVIGMPVDVITNDSGDSNIETNKRTVKSRMAVIKSFKDKGGIFEDVEVETAEMLDASTIGNNFIATVIMEESSSISGVAMEQLFRSSPDLAGGLERMGLPVTFEEYEAYKEANDREPYDGALSNQALDLKIALRGNKGKTEPMDGRLIGSANEPAVLDSLYNAIDQLNELIPGLALNKGDIDMDVYNPAGAARVHKSIRDGKGGIGAIVAPNLGYGVFSEHSMKITGGLGIKVNGMLFNSWVTKYAIDPVTGKEDSTQYRKQYVISALITAMTDNAKVKLADKLGLTKGALPTVGNLLAMGIDVKTVLLLVNHPTIKKIYDESYNTTGSSAAVKYLIKKRLQLYIKSEDLTPGNVTSDKMVAFQNRHIKNNKKKTSDISDIERVADQELDYGVLEQWLMALELSSYMFNVSKLLGLMKGLGEDTGDIDSITESIYNLKLNKDAEFNPSDNKSYNMNIKTLSEDIMENIDVRPIFKSNTLQSTYLTLFEDINYNILPRVLMNRTSEFLSIKESLLSNLSSSRRVMSGETIRKVSSDITSYLNMKAYVHWLRMDSKDSGLLASLQNSFIYGDDSGSLLSVKHVIDRLKADAPDNYFLNNHITYLSNKDEDNYSGMNEVRTNSWTKLEQEEQSILQNSMVDLYSNPATRDDLMHLIHYLVVKDGLLYSNNSFLSIVPSDIISNILNTVDLVDKLFKQNQESITEDQYLRIFGATKQDMIYELISGYSSTIKNQSKLSAISLNNIPTIMKVSTKELDIPESSVRIWYSEDSKAGVNEASLSHLAERKFKYKHDNTEYTFNSVEHAYKSLASGSFDKTTYESYKKEGGYGKTVEGRSPGAHHLITMESIAYKSITDNYNDKDLLKVLTSYSEFKTFESRPLMKAYVKGLMRAQADIVLNVESDNLITRDYATGKNVEYTSVQEKEGNSKKRKNNILRNRTEGTLIIDLEAGVKSINSRSTYAKDQEIARLHKSVKYLSGAGINVEQNDDSHESRFTVMFPKVITLRDTGEAAAIYKIKPEQYELVGLRRTGESELTDMKTNHEEGVYRGVKGVYKQIELLGSRQQGGSPFIFDSETFVRDSYKNIREAEEAKRGDNDGISKRVKDALNGALTMDERIAAAMAIADGKDGNTRRKVNITTASSVNATDKGYDLIKKDELLEDYDQSTGQTMGMASIIENSDRKTVTWGKPVESNDTTDADVEGDSNQVNMLKDLFGKTDSNDTSKIEKFLADTNKSMEIFDYLNVSNVSEIIAIFENPNNLDTQEEFIERLKNKC